MTAKAAILARLSEANQPLPIHSFDIGGVSQTSLSARLRELARAGIVESVPVPNKRYTAWVLKPGQASLPLSGEQR